MKIAGLVLAAGAGRRMGGPKALVRDPAGVAWVVRVVRLLVAAECSPILVVVGAAADQVRAELADEPVEVVEATNWAEGMGASLRAGLTTLRSAAGPEAAGVAGADAVLVVPVDVPGLTIEAVRRVAADDSGLARAVYDGLPGHPVLLAKQHWDGVIATAEGDAGARVYLREHPVVEIECGDVAEGADVDAVDQLPDGHRAG
ncbi:nucleotidyltransferase family protein [Kribbella sp. NPDC026596]|uniref:nucleotidyltransferase family protein n=1 Tax=Kribbella sp. NPDC026596 TaxID=3155122 RepID=UPI0033F12ABA